MNTVLVSYEGLAVRAAISQVLTSAGYDVLVAPPSEALAVARLHGAVDVLVTDYVPSTEDKLDLAVSLRTVHPGLRVLYAPGADGPIKPDAPFRASANGAKLVNAVARLSAPDAESSWGFCAL